MAGSEVSRRVIQGKVLPPATSLSAKENELIALAVDRVEQRIRNDTASAQELVHFLKLGSSREQAERAMLEYQTKLIEAKTAELEASQRNDGLYDRVIQAMRGYAGLDNNDGYAPQ